MAMVCYAFKCADITAYLILFAGGGSKSVSPVRPDQSTRVSPTQYNQHINKSYINSPSTHEKMAAPFGASFPAIPNKTDSKMAEMERSPGNFPRLPLRTSSKKLSGSANRQTESPIDLHRMSPANQNNDPLSSKRHNESLSNANKHLPPIPGHVGTNHEREFFPPTNKKLEDIAMADSDSVNTQSSIKSHQDDVFMPPPPDLTMQPPSGNNPGSANDGAGGLMLVETDLDLLNEV